MTGCDKSEVVIDGRCKSILIQNCRKLTIQAGAVLQQIAIEDCECVTLNVPEYLPLVKVENSTEVLLKMSQFTKRVIFRCQNSQNVKLRYPKIGCDFMSKDELDFLTE